MNKLQCEAMLDGLTSKVMARSMKLAELDVVETSGVDHPAHLHEGWLVIKSATATQSTNKGDEVDLEVTVQETEEQEPTPVVASVEGGDELRKELTSLRKELADMRVEKERIVAERELEKATERAHGWAVVPELDPATFGASLVELRKSAPEFAATLESILDATARALGEVGVLKEIGSDGETDAAVDAWGKIESLANDLVATGEVDSFQKAVVVVADRQKDLYTQYLNEKGL